MFVVRPFEPPRATIRRQGEPRAGPLSGFGRLIDLEKRSGISRLRSDPLLRRRYDSAQLRRQYANVCLKRVDIEFGRDGAVFGNGRGEVIAMSG